MQDRKEAKTVLKQSREVYLKLGPFSALKLTKSSVESLIRTPTWDQGFTLEKTTTVALLSIPNSVLQEAMNGDHQDG